MQTRIDKSWRKPPPIIVHKHKLAAAELHYMNRSALDLDRKFDRWWGDVLAYAALCKWPVNRDDRESWREYFDDGDTPEEAVNQEMTYADDGADF